jgi:hypothetical protein
MTADATRFAQAWADNAIPQIKALPSGDAIAQWILDNRYQNADCARHAPAAIVRVRAALDARELELKAAAIRDGVG